MRGGSSTGDHLSCAFKETRRSLHRLCGARDGVLDKTGDGHG